MVTLHVITCEYLPSLIEKETIESLMNFPVKSVTLNIDLGSELNPCYWTVHPPVVN